MKIFEVIQRNKRRVVKSAILAVIALAGMHGLNLWAGSGQVIDAETGKPLHGVFVMAMWNASAAAVTESRSVCYHFAIAKTNERGEYSLPEYSWNFWPFYTNRYRTKEYYLAGYDTAPNEDLSAAVVKMRRDSSAAPKRLSSMLNSMRYELCIAEIDRKEKLGDLYKAQRDESINLTINQKDVSFVNAAGLSQTFVDAFKRRWESAVLPYDDVHRNSDGTLKK